MPQVSWLVPVRNGAETLASCLRSIQRQRGDAWQSDDWECIVVDDGSTDATAEQVAAVAAREPRVRLVRTPPRGIVAALTAGLARVGSPWVARLDADDVAHSRRIDRQLAAVRAHDWVGCGAHPRMFPTAALGPGMREYADWLRGVRTAEDVRDQRFVECPLAHPTWLLRTDVLRRYGYRDEGWAEDYDLLLRLLEDDQPVGVVPRQLVAWRHHPDRTSHRDPVYSRDAFLACKAQFLVRGPLREHDKYVLWGYGGTGRRLRRALLRWDRHPSHIIDVHPGRAGQTIHGCPVLPPAALAELPADLPLLLSVAQAASRREMADYLAGLGRTGVFVA